MKKYWFMALIAFLICMFIGLQATGIKTYLYKPANPQSEVSEIYIDTDGLIYKKISSTLYRMDSNYVLPLSTTTVRGGVKVGLGLTMTGDSLGINLTAGSGIQISSATIADILTAGTGLTRTAADIALDLMTTSARGGAKVGLGLTMTGDSIGINDGTGLTVTANALGLDLMSSSARGGAKCGQYLSMTGDSIGVALMAAGTSGVAKAGVGLEMTGDSVGLILGTTLLRGGYKTGLGLTTTGDSLGINLTAGNGIAISSATISGNYTGGTGLTLTNADFALDLASASARGGVKVGLGLAMTGDSLGVVVAAPLAVTANTIGVALGRAMATFVAGDPTPDVSATNFFITSPESATTITDFDGGVDGQIIYVYCSNQANVFDFTSSELYGHAVDITPDTTDCLTFIYNSAITKWILLDINDASSTTTY